LFQKKGNRGRKKGSLKNCGSFGSKTGAAGVATRGECACERGPPGEVRKEWGGIKELVAVSGPDVKQEGYYGKAGCT